MKARRIALVSYGCAKNLVDSEVMLGALAEAGCRFTPDAAEADHHRHQHLRLHPTARDEPSPPSVTRSA